MRTLTAIAFAAAAPWSATALADSVSVQITNPKDGYATKFAAAWERSPAAAERYWLCDLPIWLPAGVGQKVSNLYQRGLRVELIATADDAKAPRVICALPDPAAKAAEQAKREAKTKGEPKKAGSDH